MTRVSVRAGSMLRQTRRKASVVDVGKRRNFGMRSRPSMPSPAMRQDLRNSADEGIAGDDDQASM